MSIKTTRTPARYYVATYGDAGLEVQLFDCPLAYGRAVRTAQLDHARGYNEWGEVDSYTMGPCEVVAYERQEVA